MNPKQRNQMIAAGALVVVLAGALWFNVFRGAGGAPGTATPGAAVAGAGTGAAESVFESSDIDIVALTKGIAPLEFQYEDQREAVDPMEPRVGGPGIAAAGLGDLGGSGTVRKPPSWPDLLTEATRKAVTGILWDPSQPLAIVDDLVVSVGYQFEPDLAITVKDITESTVVLSVDLGNNHREVTKEIKKKTNDEQPPEQPADSQAT